MNNKTPKNDEIKIKIQLKIDKDLNKLLETSAKTGNSLKFGKDNIIDFKVEGDPNYNPTNPPDLIEIGPPGFYFDLKFGIKEFKEIPFDLIDDKPTYIFKSMPYSPLDVNLEIKFKIDDLNRDIDSKLTINRKTNKIKDILNYEIRKRDFSDCIFKIIPFGNDEHKIEGKLPKIIFDDNLLTFYKQVNYINEKLKLNIVIDNEYTLINQDLENAKRICEFIKNKKIKLNKLSVSIKTDMFGLNYLLTHENKQFRLEQNEYLINLLGYEINLGSNKIKIEHYEILNYDELKEIYDNNKDNQNSIEITVILKEKDCDGLYMDFNID